MSAELTDPVVIGVIAAPHGVRGTLRVKAVGDGRHLREGTSPFLNGSRHEIITSRPTPKGFLIDFGEFTDRSEVEVLRGTELTLDRSELDAPEEDEVYVADLIGLEVFDGSGGKLGVVSETFPTVAHEILIIRDADGGAPELYLPFTLEHIPEVDLDAGRITANPPETDEG